MGNFTLCYFTSELEVSRNTVIMSNTSWGAQLKGVGGFSSLYKDNRKKVTASAENFRCQKCLEVGHYTYECQGTRKYVSKPSRTVILKRKIEGGKSGGKKKKSESSSSSSDSSSSSSDSDSSDSSSDDSDQEEVKKKKKKSKKKKKKSKK